MSSIAAYSICMQIIEYFRGSWYTVITQYVALFNTSTSYSASDSGGNNGYGTIQGNKEKDQQSYLSTPNTEVNASINSTTTARTNDAIAKCGRYDVVLLRCWLQQQLTLFTTLLETFCDTITDGISLYTIYEQCQSLALRLSVLGYDISAHVNNIFENIIFNKFQNQLHIALCNFKYICEHERYYVSQEDINGKMYYQEEVK